ncbi:MAG: DUF4445 domain-containing protein [Lachnospiraceae bacterium]|nr:DUF4445 domain-containing protein [Lachnospiraceae bacterium]
MERRRIRISETSKGQTVLASLQEQGIYMPAFCGGMGTCGKCRVRFTGDAPAPEEAERALLTPQEIGDGVRLACRTHAPAGALLELLSGDEDAIEAQTLIALGGPEDTPGASGLVTGTAAAVDLGTTTIAMSLVELPSGRVIGTAAGVNHQRAWGADVISRISAACNGKGGAMQESVFRDLALLRGKLGHPGSLPMVISGNTTMQHLLQGLSCRTLGTAPYTPVDISLHRYGEMTILPGISTYVGADIVSGIVACGMDRSEEICVLVDLGTNGEMAIGCRDGILCASTAAGPAFEGGNISCGTAGIPGAVCGVEIRDGKAMVETIGGAPPAGICGTGVVETVYELLKEGLMDETGLLEDEYCDDGFPLAPGVVFTGKDIREVQLAKAAVRAGLEVLIKEYGTDYDHIKKVWIAGGFGQKLNLEKAVGIGLLPEELMDRMEPVGNSSLAGAVMALRDPAAAERMEKTARAARETPLSGSAVFSELYMDCMFFPEQDGE